MRRVAKAAYEDNILFLGSALTFDAILAALPFLILLLAALGYAVGPGDGAVTDFMKLVDRVLPAQRGDVSILRFEDLVRVVVDSRSQLSIWGLPLFLWLATRLFASARAALNEVFDTEETRGFAVGKAVDLGMVILVLLLVIANTVLSVVLPNAPWIGRFATELTTFVLGLLLFVTVYVVLPSRTVAWDTALVAATVASLGFGVSKKLFAIYLTKFATFDRVLSNANALAILLGILWMYCTACILLLGGEVAETYDLRRRQRAQRTVLG
ncbi:MAG TPA: YihY/virulence factor BrkB family protein [Gemmatimonadales bacterium]